MNSVLTTSRMSLPRGSSTSQAALTVAPLMDQTVLVVAADQADPKPPAMLRDAIGAAGGRCAGVFFNKVEARPPRFLQRILP